MAPPTKVMLPADDSTLLAEILRRLDALERSPQLTVSSIKEGALTILDSTGAARALLGKDPSDSSYGVKNWDALGNLIFDSVGLAAVMASLGQIVGLNAAFVTSSNVLALITDPGHPSMSLTFNLVRAARVLAFATGNCSYNPTGAQTGIIDLFVDGANQVGAGITTDMDFPPTSSGAASSSCIYCQVLAAGSHTFELRAGVSGGTSALNVLQCGLFIFRLGV